MGCVSERTMAARSQALGQFQNYVSFAVDTFLFRRERPYLFFHLELIGKDPNYDEYYGMLNR